MGTNRADQSVNLWRASDILGLWTAIVILLWINFVFQGNTPLHTTTRGYTINMFTAFLLPRTWPCWNELWGIFKHALLLALEVLFFLFLREIISVSIMNFVLFCLMCMKMPSVNSWMKEKEKTIITWLFVMFFLFSLCINVSCVNSSVQDKQHTNNPFNRWISGVKLSLKLNLNKTLFPSFYILYL